MVSNVCYSISQVQTLNVTAKTLNVNIHYKVCGFNINFYCKYYILQQGVLYSYIVYILLQCNHNYY